VIEYKEEEKCTLTESDAEMDERAVKESIVLPARL